MFEIDKTWNMYVLYDYGDGHYTDLIVTETVDIDGLTYYRIEPTIGLCDNYLREDINEKKIYYRWEDQEYVLYDFSLEIGEELWINGNFMMVTNIGYGDFFGMENLRFLELDGSEKLIEGIGFESSGIAESFDVDCIYFPIVQTIHLIGMNDILANNDSQIENISIYPNPVKEVLNIESTYPANEIEIYNTLGVLVMKQRNPNIQIDLSNLPSGLLFIKIITNQGTITKKIIKE